MKTVFKVAVGLLVAATVVIVGCVALVGGAANEVGEEIDRQEQERQAGAITNRQARAVELGTTRREVERKFGPPESDQETQAEGLEDSCIYYPVRGGGAVDSWQFCFEGSGRSGRLRSKSRL